MTAPSLLSLGERVEKAVGPDRELDAAIKEAVGHAWDYGADWGSRENYNPVAKAYTASIDAAMTLVPEGWPSRQVGTTDDGRGYAAVAGNDMHMMAEDPDEFFAEGDAATAALAMCAAALKARASMVGGES